MSTTHKRIVAAAADNARLLKTLSETDYAISALQQNTSYITTLKKETTQEELNLKNVSRNVGKEYKEHKSYRDSHMRRLAYKLGGKKEKFEAEASKEEREWLEAVQEELHIKKSLEQLRINLADATKTNAELSAVASVHSSTKQELDALYKSIFEGPTPDIPGEDEKERVVKSAEENFNGIQLRLSTENQARSVLLDADRFLNSARADIEEALNAATMDAWGVGGSFADMAKSSALGKAQSHVSQVEMLMNQAMRIQPAVRSIGAMNIPEMRFMTDMVFDNIFSDLNAKDRIHDSQRLLELAKRKLVEELHAADERLRGIQGDLNAAQAELDGKRADLQQIRAAAFEAISNDGRAVPTANADMGSREYVSGLTLEGAPPGYDERPPGYTA
ncbi:hypothetical protein LSUE1_G004146 [Lachnellula suecica]|uniref:Uncharacterized protein n=1 Tax=Lachnellula suecica TaxID=602035 RepID=A0A8T9C929_9HELO|nr:hypothetical protein LSUE1_G004146 [Lachnellula suecica]